MKQIATIIILCCCIQASNAQIIGRRDMYWGIEISATRDFTRSRAGNGETTTFSHPLAWPTAVISLGFRLDEYKWIETGFRFKTVAMGSPEPFSYSDPNAGTMLSVPLLISNIIPIHHTHGRLMASIKSGVMLSKVYVQQATGIATSNSSNGLTTATFKQDDKNRTDFSSALELQAGLQYRLSRNCFLSMGLGFTQGLHIIGTGKFFIANDDEKPILVRTIHSYGSYASPLVLGVQWRLKQNKKR